MNSELVDNLEYYAESFKDEFTCKIPTSLIRYAIRVLKEQGQHCECAELDEGR